MASLSTVVVLTSCGDAATDGTGNGANGAEATPDADVRVVDDQYGTVEISGAPTRVVTPGNYETDIALALGVVPVAMGQWFDEEDGASPWRRELLAGEQPELIRYNPDGYDVEETLAFQPDLVLAGFDLAPEPYAQLSALVPTVSMPYEISGEELTRAIGRALGREAQAETLITETTAQIQAAAAHHNQLDGTSIIIVDAGSPGLLRDATIMILRNGMLEQLGLQAASAVADLPDYAELSAEDWSSLDSDLLIVNATDPVAREQLESDPLFQRIPAVAAGRYLALTDDNDVELLNSSTPPQVRYALEHVIPRIAELMQQ